VFKELRQMIIAKPGFKDLTTRQLVRHVYQQEGIRGFYRGLPAQYLAFGPFNSLGMALASQIIPRLPEDLTDLQRALIGNFLAFAFAAGVTTPIDVIKTRLQVAAANPQVFGDTTIVGSFKQVYQKAGFKGLFSGATGRIAWLGTRQALVFSTVGMAYRKVRRTLEAESSAEL
jgi:hypothetical protein